MPKSPTPRNGALAHAASALALAAAALFSTPARAVDYSLSGFATLEFAQSNREYRYLRFIDDQGTLEAGSLAAVQADLRFNPQWSATVQLKLAPSLRSDSRWDLKPNWAFIAWRPSDEWLLRVGKLRIPLYMHSESMEIGVAQDMARLPRELYSIAPSTDFRGLNLSWTRTVASDGELSVEAYHGKDDVYARFWTRDGAPPQVQPGPLFRDVNVRFSGLVATWRDPRTTLRLGLQSGTSRRTGGETSPVRFARVDLAPGIGYWQVDPALPGPGVESTSSIRNSAMTLGLERRFSGGWRLAAEYLRLKQHRTELGSDGRGGYVALFKELGPFTAYASLGSSRTSAIQMDWYRRLSTASMPAQVPGGAQIVAAQRLAAETIYLVNQDTLAVGGAYSLGKSGKLKLEWAHTRIGEATRLVDTPPGQATPSRSSLDVLTLSYSVSF